MGTLWGALFISGAAIIGVGVGVRETVIDGRRIEAEMEKQVGPLGVSVECDREIRLGAEGARFHCVYQRGSERRRIEYRMTREGRYGPAREEDGAAGEGL